jgi:hypothetical protein
VKKRLCTLMVLALTGACSGDDGRGGHAGAGGSSAGGAGGDTSSGGAGGSPGGGGSGGSGGAGSGGAGSGGGGAGGSGGSGGSGSGGSGGSSTPDAAAGGAGGSVAGDAGPGSTGALPEGALGWYEAEAKPPNDIIAPATIGNCGAPACESLAAIKEGVLCCSGKKKVAQLIRGKGQLQFNQISAPADGMYDVTWWYHCGKNDNFGDANCGGEPHTPSGCRPHRLVVNGTLLPKTYEMPCFPGDWGLIHAAVTQLPLKQGANNTIRVYATPGRDAHDMDAIAIYPLGKGIGPVIPKTMP